MVSENILLSKTQIIMLKSKEFNLLASYLKINSGYLSTEEIKMKYLLGREEEYDNTPNGFEAHWVENSGNVVYFVSESNQLSSVDEHEDGIDIFINQ